MATQPPEVLRAFAERLADALASPEGAQTARLLRAMGAFAETSAYTTSLAQQPPGARRVGVWEPKREADKVAYVRAPDMQDEWALWAQVHRIPPKGEKTRVLLIGESAAKGFLYDPKFTVAKGLESLLQARAGKDGIEVVDLARTGLALQRLVTLCECAFDLRPDAVVVFAGDNFHEALAHGENAIERSTRATQLRERGMLGLRTFFEERLVKETEQFVRGLGTLSRKHQVPIVVVVPEFNLADWRIQPSYPPWLRGTQNQQWLDCRDQMLAALDKGQYGEASTAASRLLEIDEGTCSLGYYVLADCRRKLEPQSDVRALLEKGRDAVLWVDHYRRVPHIYGVIQESMRQESRRQGLSVVDLPAVFARWLNGELPDRRLFLDYCHMSLEGIRASMIGTAETLLSLLDFKGDHAVALRGVTWNVGNEVIGEAHFAAAIHNAHWGQSREVVGYHCAKALQVWPAVAEMALHYLEMTARSAPGWMCESTEKLAKLGNLALTRFILAILPRQPMLMDLPLLAEMGQRLGSHFEETIHDIRNQEFGGDERVSALETPYFSITSLDQRELKWPGLANRMNYYRAYSSISSFNFVEEKPRDVHVRVTARLPVGSGAGQKLTVRINAQSVLAMEVGADWVTEEALVPAKMIRKGLNQAEIEWPQLQRHGVSPLEEAADDLERGDLPEYYPVFGEIYSFTVRNAASTT